MSKPSHIAYTYRTYTDVADGTEKRRWLELGAAWATRNGFKVVLHALPIDGQISLFVSSEKPDSKPGESNS